LGKIRENSPVATGQKTGKIAKISDFWQKWPKMAFLRGLPPFRGFSALLGLPAQGFYINPWAARQGAGGPLRGPGGGLRDLPGPGSRDPDPGPRREGLPLGGPGTPGDPGSGDLGLSAPPGPRARG